MNALLMRSRDVVWWIAPLVVLSALTGVMVGSAHGQATAPPADVGAKALVPTLLPEYSIGGGPDARSETVNRTLFNPTRRPAPTPVQETPKPQMQRGQFVLTGTTVVEGKATAFLREVKTGKSRRVAQGDTVNGLTVTEVKPDRVKLTAGDESEDVSLKVVANSRPTPAPVSAPAVAVASSPQGASGMPPVPGPGQTGAAGAQVAQTPEQAAQMLLERRRAARAAAADPTGAAIVAPAGGTQPAAGANNSPQGAPPQNGSQSWADVFRRYQERGGVTPGR